MSCYGRTCAGDIRPVNSVRPCTAPTWSAQNRFDQVRRDAMVWLLCNQQSMGAVSDAMGSVPGWKPASLSIRNIRYEQLIQSRGGPGYWLTSSIDRMDRDAPNARARVKAQIRRAYRRAA